MARYRVWLIVSLLVSLSAVVLAGDSGQVVMAKAKAKAAAQTNTASRKAEANRLYQQGLQQYNTSQYQAALESWQAALAIYQAIGSRTEEGHTLNALGVLFGIAGQSQTSLDFHQQALEIAREIGDRAGEGTALGSLGNAYRNLSQYQQAIDLYEQRLAIAREIGDRAGEGTALTNLGVTFSRLGQYQQAIDLLEQALTITQEIGDRAGEGHALGNLGIAYIYLGQYQQAIDLLEQQLTITREIGDRAGEGVALVSLGSVYRNLGQYQQAIDLLDQQLTITREIGDHAGEGVALVNLGSVYLSLGQYQQAIDLYEQALTIIREVGNRAGEGAALGNLGIAYSSLGQYQQAIDLLDQQLTITREIGDRAGEGNALVNLGIVYGSLGQYQQAIDLLEQRLAIAREIGDRAGEGNALVNLGSVYLILGQYQQALEQYRQAVALFNHLGNRSEESTTLSNIGKLLDKQNQSELAIVFLKASVEVRESIRGDIRGLDTTLQQSFTDTVADDYRLLADLLLQQDRIIEAQRVLDLLKVQELDDYLADVQRNAQTENGVEFWQPEEDVLVLYDDVLVAGAELQRLQAQNPDQLSPEEQTRKAELEAQQDVVYTSFIDWLDHPEILDAIDQLRIDTRSRTVDIENFTDLQASLGQLPQRSVILYPLILENRLELVLVSADAPPVRYPIEVDAIALNRAVVAFGQALNDPSSDPRLVAQQLYNWVIAPLENDLATVGAETIIFAPDGVLRYVPLAALHDGEQWLAQRFSFSQITAASETDFAARPRTDQSLLAAACEACSFDVSVGDDVFRFANLPGALREVERLIEQVPGAKALINSDFTPEKFKDLLGSYTLIHLATHGKFVSGRPDESFVLFGNNQSVNLRQMRREWSQLDADLVVLSACETALGSPELGDGIEVLGLGFQLQRVGAKAVMASLWQVSDGGTQTLMDAFYTALNNGYGKAEALRRAQQTLITGDQTVLAGERGGATLNLIDTRTGHPLAQSSDLSHPYYWAPFILIGNGL
ncbi:MAG: tetratricopeptide repeat protein [Cyanobacteria bacterium P01_F01_bin.150]